MSEKCPVLRPIIEINGYTYDHICNIMIYIVTIITLNHMNRLIYYDLLRWRHQTSRKPLLLRGARQVGKTHVIRQLGQTFKNFVEINFEKTPQFKKIFELDLDPIRIIKEISIALDTTISPLNTLFFIDEIQEMPRAIIALRYFYEEMPDLHIIGAGSLVDFAIDQVGVPVGRISFLYMYPMSFIEYLCASNNKQLANEIIHHQPAEILSDLLHIKALRLLGEYMAIGGMPKVVHEWISKQNLQSCTILLRDIKNSYEQDFFKYAKKNQIKYVDLLFKNIPRLICQQFKYSHIESDFKKRELEPALWLLEKAGIIHQVTHTAANGIPLRAESKLQKFKLLMLDVGLNQALLGLHLKDWFIDPMPVFVNKGSLSENFVGQELLAYSDPTDKQQIYYWSKEAKGSNAEVDYVVSLYRHIIPIEVKSGHGATLQSMRVFLKLHPQSAYGIRFSTHNYSLHGDIHSYPLYAVSGITEDKNRLMALIDSLV
jgi:predicted AAA+ superfamily ATPase